jgi:hypothetical protein
MPLGTDEIPAKKIRNENDGKAKSPKKGAEKKKTDPKKPKSKKTRLNKNESQNMSQKKKQN